MVNQSSWFWFFSGYSVIWKLWRKRVPQLARAHPCQTTCSSGRDAFSDPPTPHSKMAHFSSSFSSPRSTPSIPHRSGHYINLFAFEIKRWFVWRTNQWSLTGRIFLYFVPSSSSLVFPAWISALLRPFTSTYVTSGSLVVIIGHRRIRCALLFAEVPGHLKTSEANLGV